MKPKKIPPIVKAWFVLLGIWGGSLASVIGMLIVLTVSYIGLIIVVTLLLGSIVGLYAIPLTKRKTLEEWGLIDPKKEKKQ